MQRDPSGGCPGCCIAHPYRQHPKEGGHLSGTDGCLGVGCALKGVRDKGITLEGVCCTAHLIRQEVEKRYLLL